MNKVASRKSVQKKTPRGQKRKYEKESSVPKKCKKMKRVRQKQRKSSRQHNEFTEYESSRMDLIRPHQHTNIPRLPSDSSVIYVKTFPQPENIPIIDLTQSSHSILYTTVSSKSFPSNTSLKLIYKSSNFNNRLQKHLTNSLLTIPLRRKIEKVRAANSTSNLTRPSKEKLSVLDIPPEYFDEDTDGSEYAFHDLSKADLNEEDRDMIECFAMREEESDSVYSLESKQPIENMCKMYEVTSRDNFD